MLESKFQTKIVELLKNKGCWIFNIHGERMQRRGLPDLLVIGLRWQGFLELKIKKRKCSPIQRGVIREIKKRNFAVYVLRYDAVLDSIQIEDCEGVVFNIVAWDALWEWLKKSLGDPDSIHHLNFP